MVDTPDDAIGDRLGANRPLCELVDLLGCLSRSVQFRNQGNGVPAHADQPLRGFPRRPVLRHSYAFRDSGESFSRSTILSRWLIEAIHWTRRRSVSPGLESVKWVFPLPNISRPCETQPDIIWMDCR